MNNNPFEQAMVSIPGPSVASMTRRINIALNKREAFEAKKRKPAFIELEAAKKQLHGNSVVARFLIVCNADPDTMLNRERKAGYRANLKTVRKWRMLAEYMFGEHGKVNGVCKALFAATIIAARKGIPWTSNSDAEKLLFGLPHDVFKQSEELFRAYVEFSRLNIQSPDEARNQACQFRTAFENLGCYFNSREDENDLSANGIYADLNHPLIKALADKWGI